MFDAALQIAIAVLGLAALLLVTYGRASGYVVGLITTPLWIVFSVRARAWGVLILACAYGLVWLIGIYRHLVGPLGAALEDESRHTAADAAGVLPEDMILFYGEAGHEVWIPRGGARPQPVGEECEAGQFAAAPHLCVTRQLGGCQEDARR